MSMLLHIDPSPLYGRSVSREPTVVFVSQWKAAHPDGKVIDRDLNATAMPPINAERVGAVSTPEQARTSAADGIALALRLAARGIGTGRVRHRSAHA
jgi:FMN-dependent NADH-azoreductase